MTVIEQVSKMNVDNEDFLALLRENFLGTKAAALCVRYHYRGYVGEVGSDFARLDHATSVEVSGRSQQDRPDTEDPVGGPVLIKSDAVELWWQPQWSNAPLDGEPDIYKPTSVKSVRSFTDALRDEFTGQRIALLCVRYHYRGILSQVGKDFVILANACSVEVSGRAQSETPETEDPIGSFVTIRTDAIEIAWQPKWVNAPLPGEEGYRSTDR